MRLRATLTSLTAIAAALAVLAPMAPANAVPPTATGEYAGLSAVTVKPIRAGECTEAASVTERMDLTGLGAELEAGGWYGDSTTRIVRTRLNWAASYQVAGPNNFFYDSSDSDNYPTSEFSDAIMFCPDDFGTDVVTPGTYQVTATYRVYNYKFGGEICHPQEPCNGFDNIYSRTLTTTFALDYSPLCYAAKANVTALTPKVVAARKSLKKAKAAHNKKKIVRAKKRLRAVKAKLAKAKSDVEGLC